MNVKLPRKKTCPYCRQSYQPKRPLQPNVCNEYDCMVKFAVAHNEKQREKNAKADRRETKAKLEAIKPRSKWLAEVQAVFNKFVRMRDDKEPCISCGRHHEGQWHAGHYKSVGSCPELRFNELNCHRQCSACNNYLSGNIINYRVNLLAKIGHKNLTWLEGPHEPKHYSIDDLKQLKAHYQQECKRLIKEQS